MPVRLYGATTSGWRAYGGDGSPPPPPPPTVTLYGSSVRPNAGETEAQALARVSGQFGGIDVHRSYDGSAGVGTYGPYQAMDIGQMASAYSFKYLPAEVLAGDHDAALAAFFASVPAGHRTFWTYWHEPDDELYKDGVFEPADYRAAWAYIRGIADANAQPGAQLVATFCCMEFSMTAAIAPGRPLLGPDGMWPGADVCDVFGVDAYSGFNGGTIHTPSQLFDKVAAFAMEQRVPWAVLELGSSPGPVLGMTRAQWITSCVDYFDASPYRPALVCWWNSAVGDLDSTLDSDPAAIAAWRAACERT